MAGNPNSGKTTLFNALTGSNQHVGNYPGVTVEIKEGSYKHDNCRIEVHDLPGTYCLSAYSMEEIIARKMILEENPDVVVDVIDSANLERNLYLAVQLMEMNVPLLLVFNMSDVARRKGMVFDLEKLSGLLGVEIVETVGTKKEGINALKDKINDIAKEKCLRTFHVTFGPEIEECIRQVREVIEEDNTFNQARNSRWLAIKLLEQDKEIIEKIDNGRANEVVEKCRRSLTDIYGDEPAIVIADKRYGFISGACQETVVDTIQTRHDFSDRIDSVITHRVLGLPIFIALMYLVFQLTFTVGQYPMNWLESGFGWLGQVITVNWPGSPDSAILSLLVDGIIGGVGGVVVFLPNIMLLFMAIAVLEDSGYMARSAFIMDRVMHKIGLHGKSFIPMLIGFGCSIPAIMATRILENRRNRITTMLIIPLISCGARFPIYALIIPAFFPEGQRGLVLWLIYIIGIVLAIVLAKLLRSTMLKGETMPFVMELPPYRMPTLKGLSIHTWNRSWLYLKKAGTVILMISIVLWFMSSYPKVPEDKLAGMTESQIQKIQLENSAAGRIGKAMEPVIKPLGFDWKIGTALIGAMAAKEVFVSQLGIVNSLGESEQEDEVSFKKQLGEKLQAQYSGLQAFCIMLFCLISAPCMATVAITRREANSWKWAIFQWTGLTVMAYIITFIVYQTGIRLI